MICLCIQCDLLVSFVSWRMRISMGCWCWICLRECNLLSVLSPFVFQVPTVIVCLGSVLMPLYVGGSKTCSTIIGGGFGLREEKGWGF